MRSIKFIESTEYAYEVEVQKLNNFRLIGENGLSTFLSAKFSEKLTFDSQNIVITESDEIRLDGILLNFLDDENCSLIVPVTSHYFKNRPLFLISVPKAGTHLLFELAKAFGYIHGGNCPASPNGGVWYYIEYSNSHTSAKRFFNDTVYTSDFGNRNHPFVNSPAMFIYRNPLDIVVSEANYYHKSGKTAFYRYLNELDFDNRLLKLINDPWLMGSIRERMVDYIAWLDFSNVAAFSFEEIIGQRGNGDSEWQRKLIWSLQLKLHVDGNPDEIADKIFNPSSDTFFKGKIGTWRESFAQKHEDAFMSLPQDFMEALGYDRESVMPIHKEKFLRRPIKTEILSFPPILKKVGYFRHNIVQYKGRFWALPHSLGEFNLENTSEEDRRAIMSSADMDELMMKIFWAQK